MQKTLFVWMAMALPALAGEPVLKATLLEQDIAWLQASHVPDNLAEQLRSAQPTNLVVGTVLDLRFADGGTNAAGDSLFAPPSPLVILVNARTRGGAAALAAQLRAAGRGIVIGGPDANPAPDITVAVDSAAENSFQADPFAPSPGAGLALSSTNDLVSFVDHMSEAELVGRHAKDGELEEPDMPRAAPPRPVIRDPVLARAVDLLKSLAILHKARG